MASKLISGDKASGIPSIVWRGPNGAPPPVPVADNARGAAPQPEGSGKTDEQLARAVLEQQNRIQQLERELESRPRQAYQQGYNEGQAAGAQQAAARVEPVLAKLALSIQELAAARKKALLDAEEDAVKLAIAVARRVLHRELTVDPESLLGVVKAAFERVDARDIHRVRLHPEDVPVLKKHLTAAGMPQRVEIIPDPSLERGGVIVETTRGSLDASISTQMKEIEQGLVDLVRRTS